MVSINQNIFTATINAPTVAGTATSTASGAASGAPSATANVATNSAVMYTANAPNTSDPDYSNVFEILKQSEEKVAKTKEAFDETEERMVEARDARDEYYEWACKEYPNCSAPSGWPEEIKNEYYQRADYYQVCYQSCQVAQSVYNNALKNHRDLTLELESKINNGKKISTPTPTGVSTTVNAPTPTTPNVSPYPSAS